MKVKFWRTNRIMLIPVLVVTLGVASSGIVYADAGDWSIMQSSNNQLREEQVGWFEAEPVPADYDGDGSTDIAVYHKEEGMWYLLQSTDGLEIVQFGWSEAKPVPADYDGDGLTDIAVYHKEAGMWYLMQSTDGFEKVQFGWSEAKPVPADYDGDGKADIAVYAQEATHEHGGPLWSILESSSNGINNRLFGWSEAKPVPADYDGDGKADLGVYYKREGLWYILKSGKCSGSNKCECFTQILLGGEGMRHVPGDYDGDRKTDFAVYQQE